MRKTDDRFKEIGLDDFRPNLLFFATSEENAMRHDRCHHAAGPQNGEHVLEEHQISLLSRLGTETVLKPLCELHPFTRIILAERRIGDNPVEPHQLSALQMKGICQYILVLNVCIRYPVEDHVHLAYGPDATVIILAVKGEIGRISPVLLHVLL